jgi:hypothetical protein
MSIESSHRMSSLSDAVYVKTGKGRDEVTRRALNLNGRQRSVLIMLDGRKSCAALAPLMPAGQVAAIVGELLALGLIAPCGGTAPAQTTTEPIVDDAGLDRVKRYMVGAARTHLGLLAEEVVARIERAADAGQLRGVVGHWHMALRDSKHGRAAAGDCLREVREALREAGVEA